MNEEIKSRILLLMDDADEYAASQISALTAGYDAGLRVPNAACPWSNTEQLGWEWEFGRVQGANVRNDVAMPNDPSPASRATTRSPNG